MSRITESFLGKIACGKLFRQKAGFISRDWYPTFANLRRDGYDFDAQYESGKAPRKAKLIMDLFKKNTALPSYEMKRLAGFGTGGEKGFEGGLTSLQMQTYLTISGFERKTNKLGEAYGWPVSIYCLSESLFGEEYVRSAYGEEPLKSEEKIFMQCLNYVNDAYDDEIRKFIR